ncbi:phytanoyl-CoA dioxygenase family protein [uncultured Tateyamaria sp.]|uniref:phytanoyl-CoA dioxygenase family protein n=1 Tax=uncultured Tateyamaria sp. TaxID=455651 RepID=UPI0026182A19|nr:phytanoyl-CoA dioxygenase family protein [uncultured Tateyamaria sp.]
MQTTLDLAQGHLSQPQKDQYWRDGFLFPLPALPVDAALAARHEFEAMEAEWLARDLPHPLNTYKRVNAHVVMPMAARIAQEPAILDVIEGVLGPNILIYSTEFFIKEPKTTQIVSMHQDLTYWGLGAIDGLVTAWIALSPATPASGCMDFVAGSHKNAILPHADSFDTNNLLSRGQEVAVEVAEDDKTAIEIHPGQMSLHHGLTIHGSGPNRSDDRRIACVVRYVRPDVAQEVGDTDYAMLARGQDTFGNFTHIPAPSALFAPDALALYDEIRAAQAKVMMKGATAKTEIYA